MELKLKELKKAVLGFEYLVKADLESLVKVIGAQLVDGIENGKVQKFEYSMELTWKVIKKFLKEKEGVDAKTPKQAIKEFYLAGHMTEDNYILLMNMMDDRNKLSHIYEEEDFQIIIQKFTEYLEVFHKVIESLEVK